LWLLHQCPFILPKYQVDKGAIKFVLSGANIMCPGLTSPGGKMDDVDVGALVAIHAEGKEHAIAIGITTMSTKEIRTINKDIGVNNVHYVGDDLWKLEVAN
jgi:PUA domain protein